MAKNDLTADDVAIAIDPEFRNLCPALSDAELRQLTENIHRDGRFRDSLKLWKEGDRDLMVDGHNRWDFWASLPPDTTIPPPAVEYLDLPDRNAVKNWIILNQLGRRNLPPEQQAYLRGKLHQERKQTTTGRAKTAAAARHNPANRQNVAKQNSAAQIAKETGVTARTVERDDQYAAALDAIGEVNSKAKSDILAGSLKVPKKDVIAISKCDDIGKAIGNLRAGRKWNHGQPEPVKPKKPHREASSAKLVDELKKKYVSPLVRGIDDVAKINGGKGKCHSAANTHLDKFVVVLNDMRSGKQ